MKGIIALIFCLNAALTLSAPASDPAEDNKVKYDVDVDVGKISYESDLNDSSYSYRMETSDGTVKHEKGHFEEDNLVAEGGYEYVGDNGLTYSVVYVADKDGYRPKVSFGTKAGSAGPSITGRSLALAGPAVPAAPADPAPAIPVAPAVPVAPAAPANPAAPVAEPAEVPAAEISPDEVSSLVGGGGEK